MNFSSENFDGVHPLIMETLAKANYGFVPSYGSDEYTKDTNKHFQDEFNRNDIDIHYCFNGTGANNFVLSCITEKYQSILCSNVSHIYLAESTATEAFTGCRLYPVKTKNGKIILSALRNILSRKEDLHYPPPAVLSITQPTEYGTVYSREELKLISQYCKKKSILLHIDGARIFNALVSLNSTLEEFIRISNPDALTLGGTKIGLMFGEVAVFFKNNQSSSLINKHKRSMQLASKNRFIAVQFKKLIENQLWKEIGTYTNQLAKEFENEINKIDSSLIIYPVETNAVFLRLKTNIYNKLKAFSDFYIWDYQKNELRFIFSFSNTPNEISIFIDRFKKLIKKQN